jgi:hypothetical protein
MWHFCQFPITYHRHNVRMPGGMPTYHIAVPPEFLRLSALLYSVHFAAHCKPHSGANLRTRRNAMSRHPLTIYLTREQLVAVEKQARAAGMAKSAWAGQVLNQALAGQGPSTDRVFDQIIKIRATLDALVAAQPQREEIRKRIDVKVQRYKSEAQGRLEL